MQSDLTEEEFTSIFLPEFMFLLWRDNTRFTLSSESEIPLAVAAVGEIKLGSWGAPSFLSNPQYFIY